MYDTRDLSRLAQVLDSEKATAVLHAGKGLEEAEIYVDTKEQSLTRLYKVTKDLGVLLKKLIPSARDAQATQLVRIYKEFETAVKTFINKVS